MGDVVRLPIQLIKADPDEVPTEDVVLPAESGYRSYLPPLKASVASLRRFLEHDLEDLRKRRPKSFRTLQDSFLRFPDDFLAQPIVKVTPAEVAAVVRWMEGQTKPDGSRRWEDNTVRSTHAYLHAALERALQAGLVETNPAHLPRGTLPPARPRAAFAVRQQALSPAEASRLISSHKIPLLRRVGYAIELYTGVRISELCGLRWSSLHAGHEDALSRLEVEVQWIRGATDETKNGDIRVVPVHPELAKLLETWREIHWPGRATFRHRRPAPHDLIVPGLHRGRLHPQCTENYNIRLKEDLARVSVRSRTSHALRKSFIQLCVDAGADKQGIMSLTHREPISVSTIYHYWSFERVSLEVLKHPVRIALPTRQLDLFEE